MFTSLFCYLLRSVSAESGHSLGGSAPFNTTSLHIFIKESFADALLLEQHQVSTSHMHVVCSLQVVLLYVYYTEYTLTLSRSVVTYVCCNCI